MALEAVVFQQDLFGYNGKDLYSLFGGNWSCEFGLEKEDEKSCCFDTLESQTETSHHYENWNSPSQPPPPSIVPHLNEWHHHNSSPEGLIPKQVPEFDSTLPTATSSSSRPKRRRSKSKKNQEEIENQRMTHIAVERNRRKQMNEYLSVLRSLMPESYVQRVSVSFLSVPVYICISFQVFFWVKYYYYCDLGWSSVYHRRCDQLCQGAWAAPAVARWSEREGKWWGWKFRTLLWILHFSTVLNKLNCEW